MSIIIDGVLLLLIIGLFILNRSQKKMSTSYRDESLLEEKNKFKKSVEKITKEQYRKLDRISQETIGAERNISTIFQKMSAIATEMASMKKDVKADQTIIQAFNEHSKEFTQQLPQSQKAIEMLSHLCNRAKEYGIQLEQRVTTHNNIIDASLGREKEFTEKMRQLEYYISEITDKVTHMVEDSISVQQRKIDTIIMETQKAFQEGIDGFMEEEKQKIHNFIQSEQGAINAMIHTHNTHLTKELEYLKQNKTDISQFVDEQQERLSMIKEDSILTMRTIMGKQEEEIQTKLLKLEDDIQLRISNLKEVLETDIHKAKTAITPLMDTFSHIKQEVFSQKEEVSRFYTKIKSMIVEENKELSAMHQKVSEEVYSTKANLEDIRTELKTELIKKIGNYSDHWDKEVQQKKNELDVYINSLDNYLLELQKKTDDDVSCMLQNAKKAQENIYVQYEKGTEDFSKFCEEKYMSKEKEVNNYIHNLEGNLSELQTRIDNDINRMMQSSEEAQGKIYTQYEKGIEDFSRFCSEKYASKEEEVNEYVDTYISDWKVRLEEKRNEFEDIVKNLGSHVNISYEDMKEKLETYSHDFENDIQEVRNENAEQIEHIKEEYVKLQEQLYNYSGEIHKENLVHLDSFKDEYQNVKEQVVEAHQKNIEQLKQLEEEYEHVEEQTKEHISQLHEENMKDIKDKHAENILDTIDQTDQLLKDAKKYGETIQSGVKKDSDQLRKEFLGTRKNIEENINEITEHVDALSKKSARQKEFLEKDTFALEELHKLHADASLQTDLIKQNILDIKAKSSEYEKLRKKFRDLETHVESMSETVEKLRMQESDLKNAIKNHERLGKQIKKIDVRSEKIDNVIELLQQKEEKILALQQTILDIQSTQKEINKYGVELEKSKKAYEHAIDDSHVLEKNIIQLEKEAGSVKDEISSWDIKVKKMSDIISSIEQKQSAVKEIATEVQATTNNIPKITEKLQEITDAQRWIADLETRLQNLNREASEKLSLLSLVSSSSTVAGSRRKEKLRMTEKTKEMIRGLYEYKYSKERIAQVLKISVGEVEMVLGQTLI